MADSGKPVAEQTLQERMLACGNDTGLKLLKERGDATITEAMIEQAATVRAELMKQGPGYREGRRGW